MMHFDDISDDEIRIIGNSAAPTSSERKPRLYRQWWFWVALIVLVVVSLLTLWNIHSRRSLDSYAAPEAGYDVIEATPAPVAPTVMKNEPASVLVHDTVINDVPLRILTPVNAVPELCLGIPDTTDENLVLGLQAADIRADNGGIVGAFVLKGELLSRGVAKKGFCAIIDGKIHLGRAESTPLFEEAINKEGYFFRQYLLVDQGNVIENKPKGKALRHALCEIDGHIVTVSSLDQESFHDFAQALADLGVKHAVYLVGKQGRGFSRSAEGLHSWGIPTEQFDNSPNVNYIVWRAR